MFWKPSTHRLSYRQTPWICALFGLLLLLVACGDASEPAATPAPERQADLSMLVDGWNTIEPGEPTTCSDGSPFSFFVRPGNSDLVHFYLEGGGACWNGATCDLAGQPTYSPVVNETDGQSANGVFAFDREDNPLRDYTTIFVPYCSGDVHLGDRTVEYTVADEEGERSFTIEHRGLANGRAAMDWLEAHLGSPSAIFVSGSSAGSIPSPVYASWIAEAWPNARVTSLGDGAGGYRGATEEPPYVSWGTQEALAWARLKDLGSEMSFEDLYVAAAARQPRVRYATYDTAEDSVQLDFLRLGNQPTESLLPLIDANYEEIAASNPEFRRFVAGGELHTILRSPEVYTYRVGDRRFVDWLADLVEGRDPGSVRCSDCAVAEVIEQADSADATE